MPRVAERDLEVAEAGVDGRPVRAGEGADLAPRQRLLGDEQEGLEGGLGQLDRWLGFGRTGIGGVAASVASGAPGVSSASAGVRLVSGVGGHANDSRVSSIGASSSDVDAGRGPLLGASSTRATIGPHGSACSTTISRRFISSSMARNVIAMTTRSRTPASRSWRTTVGASRRAARMIVGSLGDA